MFHKVLKSLGYFNVRGMSNSSHEGISFSNAMSSSHRGLPVPFSRRCVETARRYQLWPEVLPHSDVGSFGEGFAEIYFSRWASS